MKAERRHELQQNTLARAISDLPQTLRQHGSRILLVLVIIALAIVLIYRWRAGKVSEEELRAGRLGVARQRLDLLMSSPSMPTTEIQTEIEAILNDVLTGSSEAVHQANAKLIRGDLNYLLATRPGATTRPGGGDLLAAAQRDYDDLIAQSANLPWTIVAPARLGRGAIAEDRADWAAARAQYDAVVADARVDGSMKALAAARLQRLSDFQKPLLVGKPRQPETQPATTQATTQGTTQPATTQASTQATTQPATTQASTQPETAPSTQPVP